MSGFEKIFQEEMAAILADPTAQISGHSRRYANDPSGHINLTGTGNIPQLAAALRILNGDGVGRAWLRSLIRRQLDQGPGEPYPWMLREPNSRDYHPFVGISRAGAIEGLRRHPREGDQEFATLLREDQERLFTIMALSAQAEPLRSWKRFRGDLQRGRVRSKVGFVGMCGSRSPSSNWGQSNVEPMFAYMLGDSRIDAARNRGTQYWAPVAKEVRDWGVSDQARADALAFLEHRTVGNLKNLARCLAGLRTAARFDFYWWPDGTTLCTMDRSPNPNTTPLYFTLWTPDRWCVWGHPGPERRRSGNSGGRCWLEQHSGGQWFVRAEDPKAPSTAPFSRRPFSWRQEAEVPDPAAALKFTLGPEGAAINDTAFTERGPSRPVPVDPDPPESPIETDRKQQIANAFRRLREELDDLARLVS